MKQESSSRLGRGLDGLIPTNFDSSIVDGSERIQNIPVDKITANPDQPRRNFDENAISELSESIKQYGVLQPLVVTKKSDNFYVIVAGERRFRASVRAQLKKVPAIVRSHQELESLEIAIVENVQRVDLSPLEQAASIQKLHEQFSLSYTEIAKKLGKASTTVNNIVRLMQLPDSSKQALASNKISEGHARAILALKDLPDRQDQLLKNIIEKGWSVRQAEQFVVSTKQGSKSPQSIKDKMATTNPGTKKLSNLIGSPVQLRRTAKGGRIEIAFKNDSELEKILKSLLK